MNQDDLAVLRQALVTQRAEIMQRLEGIAQEMRHETRPLEADSAERVSAGENDEVLNALGSSGQKELADINAALARLDDGHYGICVACGESIGLARLQAIPYASKCIRCS